MDDNEPGKISLSDERGAPPEIKAEGTDAPLAEGSEDDFHSAMEAEDKVGEEDEESLEDHTEIPEDEDEISVKTQNTEADADASITSSHKTKHKTPKGKRAVKAAAGSSVKKGRTPSVKGLTIPFRTVKKAMKLEPETPIVQNEAAIMTTFAVELFLKKLAVDAFRNAKNRGRNTVRYEDVAEARTNNKALSFLEPLLP